MRRLLR